MKITNILLLFLCALVVSTESIAQATFANNAVFAGRFLGFNGAQDLEFRTNNLTRMTLMQTTGRLGLGTAALTSLLHLNTTAMGDLFRTDGPGANDNRWQLFTGGTERYRLWTNASTGTVPWVNQTADNSLGFRLHTPSAITNSTPLIRMQINGYRNSLINGYTINSSGYTLLTNTNTFLTTAGAPQTPYSLLHLVDNG